MRPTRRTLTLAALGCLALTLALPAVSSAVPAARTAQAPQPAASVDPVIDWNRFLLDLQTTPGDQPATVHPTYELAMLHAAINDAAVTIDHSGKRYLTRVHAMTDASPSAAADAAAHDTLVALYPTLGASIDQHYASLLGQVPAGRRKRQRRSRRSPRRGAAAQAARRRRLERVADPIPARHEPRRLPAHAARVRTARVHALVAREAVPA